MSDSLKVSKGALRLVEDSLPTNFQFKQGDTDEKPKFRMVGYSGGVIKNHWFWGNLAIDLEGLKFDKGAFPILRDHDTNREIGFSKKPLINKEGLVFTDDQVTLLDNEESNKFQKNAKEGFPYQASIYAIPSIVERLDEGESIEVNGHTLKGPGTVWRKAAFKECSVCVFGHDDQTSSQVFSHEEGEVVELNLESIGESTDHNDNTNGGKPMDLEKFMTEHKELYDKIVADTTTTVSADIEAKFQKKLDDKDSEIATLSGNNDKLTKDITIMGEKVNKLEKNDIIRTEEALDAKAKSIWVEKLSDSSIPDRLHEKVRAMVKRDAFMAEGKFDEEAFSKAVDDEICDWEDNLGSSSVQGLGFSTRTVDGSEGDDKNKMTVDATVDRMLGHIGRKKQQD